MAKRAEEAILALASSERPDLLGIRKSGRLENLYAWELGRECRLLYAPDFRNRVIEFHRICSHKEVYQD